jgi:hypothetical protein
MIVGENFTGSKYRSRQPPISGVTFRAVSCFAAGFDAAATGVLAQDAEQGCPAGRSRPVGERKQGSVRRHRIIISTTVLLALSGATVPVALGDPLLSGYGSPGEGSQAMIGATLVNGPRGGGGSGSSGVGGASTGEGAVNLAAPAASSRSSGSSSATRGGSSSKSGSARGAGTAGTAGSGARAQSADQTGFASYPRSERVVGAQTSFVSGVSGSDLLYALVALGCLLLTAFATVRLAKRTVQTRVER